MDQNGYDEFLGVDIGGTKLMLSYISVPILNNAAINFDTAQFDRSPTGPEFSAEKLKEQITKFLQTIQPPSRKITAVGVSVCGFIDPQTEAITLCEISNLTGTNPKAVMKELFGSNVSVVVENDVRAGTIAAEYVEVIAGNKIDNMAVLVAGTGLGLGCIVNGQLMRGSVGWAGCLGCAPVRLKTGEITTFDAALGGRGIVKKLQEKVGLDIEQVLQVLQQVTERNINNDWKVEKMKEHCKLTETEETIIQIISDAAEIFGMAIATVLSIFNPAHLVLAGGVLSFEGFVQIASSTAQKNTMEELWNNCQIKKSKYSNQLVSLGVLLLAYKSTR